MAYHLPEYYDEVIRRTLSNSEIAVGWGQVGDLRQCAFGNERGITNLVSEAYPTLIGTQHANGGRSLWNLYHEMQIGDLVIVNKRTPTLTMRVVGDYFYDYEASGTEDYDHRRKAEAVPIDPIRLWQMSGKIAPGQSCYPALVRCARSLTDDGYKSLLM